MKKRFCWIVALYVAVLSTPVHATTSNSPTSPPSPPAESSATSINSDYISASLGDYDFDKGGRRAVDYRLDYQWGLSLLPMLNSNWSNLENVAALHPVMGFEGDNYGMAFVNGGLNLDISVGSNVIVTWGEVAGWCSHGDDRQSLGSPVEFRSQLEVGWKFDNNMRLSGYISHISNAGIGDHNPGAEVVGSYLKIPVSWLAH